jgi:RNA 3'-terminal phosphate cyclase (ATP)
MITIDGSKGEGGGQIVRSALALSVLTGQPIQIDRIRAGRSKPGLRPQHLAAVQASAALCDARLSGATLDSQTLTFHPRHAARAGTYRLDVAKIAGRGSAGSVGLVLQTVLLPLATVAGSSRLTLRGGTHVPWAPSIDYVRSVFLPTVADMGVEATIKLVDWGFYPAGGGEARIEITGRPTPLEPITLVERGAMRRVWGHGVAANLPSHIPQRLVNRARNLLADAGINADVQPMRVRGKGPGAGIFLFAAYEHAVAGFTAYGRKGLPSEEVAQVACDALLAHHRAGQPVDLHLADQLILPMALAAGTSHIVTSNITQHLLTNLNLIQSLLPVEARVEGRRGQPGAIFITGKIYD